MLDEKAATARLARQMRDAESAIAEALVDATALMHSCALAARDNSANTVLVQTAFMRTQKMAQSLVEARGEASRTHGTLNEIYREKAGTLEPYPCPDTTFTGAELEDSKHVA